MSGRAPPKRRDILPASLPPRGLSREEAAAYIGCGVTLFDQMVADGRMPQPRMANARTLWDRRLLDFAFEELPLRDEPAHPPRPQAKGPKGWEDYR